MNLFILRGRREKRRTKRHKWRKVVHLLPRRKNGLRAGGVTERQQFPNMVRRKSNETSGVVEKKKGPHMEEKSMKIWNTEKRQKKKEKEDKEPPSNTDPD